MSFSKQLKISEDSENQPIQTQKLLEAVLDSIAGGHWWKDREGHYLGLNKETARTVGLGKSEGVIGKTDFDMPWASYAKKLAENDQLVMSSKKSMTFEEYIEVDSNPVFLLTTKAPLFDEAGNVIGTVGTSVDITELKETQKKLEAAKVLAEAANKLKTEFIQNMQHDIRTPISGIWSVLNGYMQNPDPQGLQEVLPLIVKAAEQLLNICNEVIDFENIAYGDERVQLRPLSLLNLVNNVIELNTAAVIARGLYLQLDVAEDVPACVISDEHKLKKIIINLVGNAIKFTQQGGVILRVVLTKKTKTKCSLQLIVEDTGIGIPADKTDEIFEKFSRLNPSDTQLYKGTGLGLFLVRSFIKELGGSVTVNSTEGKGTTFTISLDVAIAEDGVVEDATERRQYKVGAEILNAKGQTVQQVEVSHPMMTEVESTKTRPNILMIEDDPLALFAAQHIWRQLAVKVNIDTATQVQEARQFLQTKTYDLVLCDLGLPDGTGDELVREIRRDSAHRNYKTPMIALTAHNDVHRHKIALDAGFNTVLCKPLMVTRAQHLLDIYVTEFTSTAATELEQGRDMEDIIDWELCLNMVNGRESLALELLSALTATFPTEQKALTEAFNVNDVQAVRAILHRFRGGLCYLGVPRLTMSVEMLQQRVKSTDDLTSIRPQLDALFAEMKALEQAYQQLQRA